MMDGNYYVMTLDNGHAVALAARFIDGLYGLVSEKDGGIIGYFLDEEVATFVNIVLNEYDRPNTTLDNFIKDAVANTEALNNE